MQEPKIHSTIDPFLPDDHWLFEYMEPNAGTGEPTLNCRHCGFAVYTKSGGTCMTWVETGFLVIDDVDPHEPDGHVDPGVWDIFCFGNKDDQVLYQMHPQFALNDDGSPQPVLDMVAAAIREGSTPAAAQNPPDEPPNAWRPSFGDDPEGAG